ncbi:MAG: hypothetical protein ACRC45_06410 [Cetobacterium sp.]
MASQKLHKITKIVKEVSASADGRYNIDGVNLSLAKYLWREKQELFNDLNGGDYRIEEVGGSTFVVITSDVINKKIEAFQVAYILDFTASKYETDYDVDVNTLKNKFNLLVDDTQNMWEHLRKHGMLSDITGFDVIMPELVVDEVWVKTETGFRGLNIGNLEENIKELIEQFRKEAEALFLELLRVKTEYVQELEHVKDGQLEILEGWLNQNIDRIQKAGSDWLKVIKERGEYETARVDAKGEEKISGIVNQGNIQSDRLTNLIASTDIDTKLIIMNQMFDIIVGSNRYINGNSIVRREDYLLDRLVTGKKLSTRQELRSSYDGGLVSTRTVTIPPFPPSVTHPITIDLGGSDE